MIELVTLAVNEITPVWKLAAQTWHPYAARHGYLLTAHTQLPLPKLAPSWNKVKVVLDHLENGADVVWWIDADMTIFNPVPLEALAPRNKEVVFSRDWNGLCAGLFRATSDEWTREFLRATLLLGDVANDDRFGKGFGCKWEQNTFKTLLEEFPSTREHIGFLAQGVVNDNPLRPRPGEIVLHYGARPNAQRIAMMKQRHPQLI